MLSLFPKVPKPKKKKTEKESPKKAEKKPKDAGKAKGASSDIEKGPNGELMFQVS